jgi:hypothetical protein
MYSVSIHVLVSENGEYAVTSPPAKARGLPLIAERLSCFAEAGLAWFSSPHQVLRPLHRQQPRAPRPKCSVRQ